MSKFSQSHGQKKLMGETSIGVVWLEKYKEMPQRKQHFGTAFRRELSFPHVSRFWLQPSLKTLKTAWKECRQSANIVRKHREGQSPQVSLSQKLRWKPMVYQPKLNSVLVKWIHLIVRFASWWVYPRCEMILEVTHDGVVSSENQRVSLVSFGNLTMIQALWHMILS